MDEDRKGERRRESGYEHVDSFGQRRSAQENNILAAQVIAETIRTTLGPKGMDKMLVDEAGNITITNDGVTILRDMAVSHPSARMIVDVAQTQETEVGDGTTSAVVLAGSLLKNAQNLLSSHIHPTIIAKGYRLASSKALEFLMSMARPLTSSDEDILRLLAETAMTGKGAESAKESLARLAITSIRSVMAQGQSRIPRENIRIETTIGGEVKDSELIHGLAIDRERVHSSMPARIQNAKIALVASPIEIRGPETSTRIQISNPEQLQSFIDQEEKMLEQMIEALDNAGVNVVFCQKGIDEMAQQYLARKGILAFRRVRKSDMAALAKATGAQTITSLDRITSSDLGLAGSVEEKEVAGAPLVFVRDCEAAGMVTILLKGATSHVVQEVQRAMEDAIGDISAAIEDGKVIAGAGSVEIGLARQLRTYAQGFPGREQLAISSFADALEIIPKTLAENAGLDPIDTLTELKAAHDKGQSTAGVNVYTGEIVDAVTMGVLEPLRVKRHAISSASQVAEMILRIDDVIASGGAHQSGE